MNKKKIQKPYYPKQPYKPERVNRPRKSVHSSRLPYWLARQPLVQKFNKMSKKRKLFLVGYTSASVLIVTALITTVLFANSLGTKESIMNRNKTGVTLLDKNGVTFYEFYNARSETYVPLEQISEAVKKAAVASEDKDFYNHHGFSPLGITNAVWQNVKPNGLKSGGSTITQQLVASSLLTKERSYLRKYQELILSIEIERRYSKDEILEMYLNSVYFGEGSFGIEDAAQTYFEKNAKDLSLAESSIIIGLLPAPSAYSPISGDIKKAESRQDYVLRRMTEDGYITKAESEAANIQVLNFANSTIQQQYKAPHFALMAKSELEQKYGEEKVARSGYKVVTTLDLNLQAQAEAAVADQISRLSANSVSNGAAIAIDPKTGEIRVLVGSHNWYDTNNGKINMTTATRQPGSSFKPIVFASGIENKVFSAATIWKDEDTDFGGGYRPKNYDLRYHGNVTTRQALANSYNIPAVAALQKNGIPKTLKTAQDLGISTMDDANSYGLSLALGSAQANLLQMTNAYATLANEGLFKETTTISSITNKNEREIYKHSAKTDRAISNQSAFIMSSMMSDPSARSGTFGSSLNLQGQRQAAVKTGTTENYRDAWTIGYTPSMAVGVWIGNNDNTPMSRIAGSSGAAPIWRNIMNTAHQNVPRETFKQPGDITVRSICPSNGGVAVNTGDNTITEYFRPGTLPNIRCNETAPEKEVPADKPAETPKPEKEEKPPKPNEDEDEAEPTPPDDPEGENPVNPPSNTPGAIPRRP